MKNINTRILLLLLVASVIASCKKLNQAKVVEEKTVYGHIYEAGTAKIIQDANVKLFSRSSSNPWGFTSSVKIDLISEINSDVNGKYEFKFNPKADATYYIEAKKDNYFKRSTYNKFGLEIEQTEKRPLLLDLFLNAPCYFNFHLKNTGGINNQDQVKFDDFCAPLSHTIVGMSIDTTIYVSCPRLSLAEYTFYFYVTKGGIEKTLVLTQKGNPNEVKTIDVNY